MAFELFVGLVEALNPAGVEAIAIILNNRELKNKLNYNFFA